MAAIIAVSSIIIHVLSVGIESKGACAVTVADAASKFPSPS
jgi:hypothetical protein